MPSTITQTSQAPQTLIPQSQSGTQSKPPQGATKTTGVQDSVQLSSASQARLAALQEATETPAQTAQEARGGDLQALKLVAKENAAAKLTGH